MKTTDAVYTIKESPEIDPESPLDLRTLRYAYSNLRAAALALVENTRRAPMKAARAALDEMLELEAAESGFAAQDDGRHSFEAGYLRAFLAGEMSAETLATVKARIAHMKAKGTTNAG